MLSWGTLCHFGDNDDNDDQEYDDFEKIAQSNLILLFQGDSLSLAFISGQSEAVLVR